jgi:ADP-L-glycero-D-manno-heptose 6-epimerase
VRDAVAVTLFLCGAGAPSGLINCGSGRAWSWLDLAHVLYAALGRTPSIRLVDMPEHLRARYQYFTQAETGKLQCAGYSAPFTSLEDGVRDYVQSHLGVGAAVAAAAS